MVDKTQTQTEQTIDKVQKAETLDDLDALEQDINAEDTEPDTGGNDTDIDGNDNPDNNPGEKPKDQPTEPANKSKDKKEKTAISDEQRKKFDIPEKFKYWEDVVAWGSESEKAKNKYDIEKQQAINEKEQAINEREQYKSEIKKLREQLEQAGNSQASQQELVKEFNELFIEDPIKAIKKVVEMTTKVKQENTGTDADKAEKEKAIMEKKRQLNEQAAKDLEEICKGLNQDERKAKILRLQKLANERPYITSLYDLDDIDQAQQARLKAKFDKEEQEKKEQRRQQITAQANLEAQKKKNSTLEKIKKATTPEQLDELEAEINGAE